MRASLLAGLQAEGSLPGGLGLKRRAKKLRQCLCQKGSAATVSDWLCVYAFAVSEENAAGHAVVTAPTNGAAGVIPALLYYAVSHLDASSEDIRTFLLTAAAIAQFQGPRLAARGKSVPHLIGHDVEDIVLNLKKERFLGENSQLVFLPEEDIVFDLGDPLPQHPNGMIFQVLSEDGDILLSDTCFSIGGGFLCRAEELEEDEQSFVDTMKKNYPYPFDSSKKMIEMSRESGHTVAEMKLANEGVELGEAGTKERLDTIWEVMRASLLAGLQAEGSLPGGLGLKRRAKKLRQCLCQKGSAATVSDWLCVYAFAVSEENAAGHAVVTAPTNGAA
ncbi:unnamed protein product, partial [Cyprideis torosa]